MNKIGDQVDQLLEVTREAMTWVNEFVDKGVSGHTIGQLKSCRRELKRLRKSSLTPPALAIYGQSQVGKSYLVKNLVKGPQSTELMIKAGKDRTLNFLSDINPDGQKESTGTITRFAFQEQLLGSEDFPFRVDLLSSYDLVAIITDGYLSDIVDYVDLSRIDQNVYSDLAKEQVTTDFYWSEDDEDSLSDLIDYVESKFRESVVLTQLNSFGFFQLLKQHLPHVVPKQRHLFFSFLWGNNSFLSEVYQKLYNGIEKLGHEQRAFVSLHALTPNNVTIVDVERVRTLFDDVTDEVAVRIQDGDITINRSVLACLTREVSLVIERGQGDSSFRDIEPDVLDFPGSRSREQIPEPVFSENSPSQKMQLFIRGKVSYLFDIYNRDFLISMLLYCIDDSQPEEVGASARLHSWIRRYVGAKPAERESYHQDIIDILGKKSGVEYTLDQISTLLVVLTKFNVEMSKDISNDGDPRRHDSKWDARIGANFRDWMQRPVKDKWVDEWNTDMPFSFLYPLRDPLYSGAIFEVHDGLESRIRDERVNSISAIGDSFLAHRLVKRHVKNCGSVWEELVTPNKTGIENLILSIRIASDKVILETKFDAILKKVRDELSEILSSYVTSGNITEDLERSRKEARDVHLMLRSNNVGRDKLSELLRGFVLKELEVWNLLYAFKFKDVRGGQKSRSSLRHELVDLFGAMGVHIMESMSSDQVADVIHKELYPDEDRDGLIERLNLEFSIDLSLWDNAETTIAGTDRASVEFADQVIALWNDKILSITSMMSKSIESELASTRLKKGVQELLSSADRCNLREYLSGKLDGLVDGIVDRARFDLVTSISCSVLNNFLFSAGWISDKLIHGYPQNPLRKTPIFGYSEQSPEELGEQYRSGVNGQYIDDWLIGMVANFEANVRNKYELDISESVSGTGRNAIIKRLVDTL